MPSFAYLNAALSLVVIDCDADGRYKTKFASRLLPQMTLFFTALVQCRQNPPARAVNATSAFVRGF